MNRTNRFRLHCEPLESRDVPAILLDGTFDGTTTTPTGGFIGVTEIDGTFTAFSSDLTLSQSVTASTFANDFVTLSVVGTTLVATDSDGIFIRVTNQNNMVVLAGNSVNVPNVAGIIVFLQAGGNDVVADFSMLPAVINTGFGNDLIFSSGTISNPALAVFVQTPIDPALFPLFGALGGFKALSGGPGDDSITGPLLGFANQYDGGSGNDTITGGLGPDNLIGSDGVDVLTGLGGGDFYFAFDGFVDYVLNAKGDLVSADSIDFVAVR